MGRAAATFGIRDGDDFWPIGRTGREERERPVIPDRRCGSPPLDSALCI
jgi:hypothetical protein